MERTAEERSSTVSLSSGEHISDGEESIRSDSSRVVKGLQMQTERWADCTAEWRERWGKMKEERDFALKKARSYKKRLEEVTARLRQLEEENRVLQRELKPPLPSPQQQLVAVDEGIGSEESAEPVTTVHFRRRSEPAPPRSYPFSTTIKDDGLGSSAESSSPPIPSAKALDLSAFSLETELKLIQDLVKKHSASDIQCSPQHKVVDLKVFGPVEGGRDEFSFWAHKKSALSKSLSSGRISSVNSPAAVGGPIAGVPASSSSLQWPSKATSVEKGRNTSRESSMLLLPEDRDPTAGKAKLSLGRKVELPSERPPHAQSGGEKATQSGGEKAMQSGGEKATQSGGEKATQSGGEKAMQSGGEKAMQTGGEKATQKGGKKAKSPPGEKSVISSSGKSTSEGEGEKGRRGSTSGKGSRPFADLATRKAMYAAAVQQTTKTHPPLPPGRKTYSLSQDSATSHNITPLGITPGHSSHNEANPSSDEATVPHPPLPATTAPARRPAVAAQSENKPSSIAVRERKGGWIMERRGTWTAGYSPWSTPTIQRAMPYSVGGASTMPYSTRRPLRKP